MIRNRILGVLLTGATALALYAGGPIKHPSSAQSALQAATPQAAQTSTDAATPVDPLQWSYRIDRYNLEGDSSAARRL